MKLQIPNRKPHQSTKPAYPIPLALRVGAWIFFGFWVLGFGDLCMADTGADVVVVYNSRMPESKEVAEHYAKRRGVPASQLWGLDVSTSEAVTRTEYLEKIQSPILK